MRPWIRNTVCKYLGRGTLAHSRAHTRTHTGEASKEGRMWVVGWGETGRGGYLRCEPNLLSLMASQTKRRPVQYLSGVAAVTARRVLLQSREGKDSLGASGKDEAVEMQLPQACMYPDGMRWLLACWKLRPKSTSCDCPCPCPCLCSCLSRGSGKMGRACQSLVPQAGSRMNVERELEPGRCETRRDDV